MVDMALHGFLHRRGHSIFKLVLYGGILSLMLSELFAVAEEKTETPPFSLKVDVNLVVLNVAVVDEKGANVTSLRKEDFVVYEDDVKQEVSDFLPVEAPFNLVLALDTSISTRSSLSLIKQAATKFTDQLRPSDRIAVTQIDFRLKEVQRFTSSRRQLREAIGLIATSATGGSKIYDGLVEAGKLLQKVQGGRKGIVLLSDGMENSSRTKFEDLRRFLAQLDIVFYPVTILNKGSQKDLLEDFIKKADKKKPDVAPYVENAKVSLSVLEQVYQIQTERLQTLTDETGGKIFLVGDLADLAEEYAKVANELRNTFSLAYYSKNKERDGTLRKIRVEAKDPRYRVRSRTSYLVSYGQ
jgi:Ca-activated chloride channel homolog